MNHTTTLIHNLELTDPEFTIIINALDHYICECFSISDREKLDASELLSNLTTKI